MSDEDGWGVDDDPSSPVGFHMDAQSVFGKSKAMSSPAKKKKNKRRSSFAAKASAWGSAAKALPSKMPAMPTIPPPTAAAAKKKKKKSKKKKSKGLPPPPPPPPENPPMPPASLGAAAAPLPPPPRRPAFQSRVTCALRYKQLDATAREKVWRNLLGTSASTASTGVTAIASASSLDYPALASHALNGREIKNVLRLGLALARREKVPLSMKHLEATIAIAEDFVHAVRSGVDEIDSM